MIKIADLKLLTVRDENESNNKVGQNSMDESMWLDSDDETEIQNATKFGKTKPPPRSTQVEVSALKMQHKDWKERHEDCGPILDGGAIKKEILGRELTTSSLNIEIVEERRIRKKKLCIGLAREHQHQRRESNGRYWGDFLGK